MRTWNVTGLYKAQRDRQRSTRARRMPAMVTSRSTVVLTQRQPLCNACGFALDTNAHKIFCHPERTQTGRAE